MITNRFGRQRFRTGEEFWFLSELGDVRDDLREESRADGSSAEAGQREDFARFSSPLCRIL